jgi:glycosyltransferase involved in cell wall biosynthesis
VSSIPLENGPELFMSRIVYIQYTNPALYPPLEHSSRILADAGWDVLFLGTGAEGLRFPHHERITVKEIPFRSAGWRQKLHYARFALWILFWAIRWRPAWVYASDPLSCPVALVLSYLPGIRVAYHEHDSPHSGHTWFMRFVFWTRRSLSTRATLCIVPNEQRAKRFAEEIGNGVRVDCVWNCPTRDEVSEARPPLNGALRVLYHGSIVPARLPTTVLTALSMLPDGVCLRVVGYETIGHKGYVRQLQELAAQLGIAGRVEFLSAVPRGELLTLCRQCDVGLSLMPRQSLDHNERTMTGASNKPFDYLACGLALLVPDLSDWRALFVDNGYALAVDPADPASMATAVRWLLEHPPELRAMGERGRQRILREWNYEQQFAPVLQRLTKQPFSARCS